VLHRRGVVESTMLEARGLPVGDVVVADHQTAGRGRLGRSWEAPPGSGLFATFVVPLDPLAVFRCGVAAAEACGPRVRLKWPNDLLLRGRKLGGVLAEAVPPGRCLVGLGVNLTWAPPGAARLGGDRDQLLERLLPLVAAWTAAPAGRVIARWRELSDTLGHPVRVELPGEVLEGLAEEIAEDGALLVGGRRVLAGDITRLRRA
jgi:BirA family transcriptional regulator, biotin operon repressor / biotin---[acetyl-CoA-carboxylase] ligase